MMWGGGFGGPRGLQPKRVDRDAEVASYEDPWDRSLYALRLDFRPASSGHHLETRNGYEWGELIIIGYGANPPIIARVILGANAAGEPTLAIRSVPARHGQG